ncbi:MAG: energy-coupling factor transporter ATPase [Butyrivibrio sp.]|nr:energy-coupling factor transporter ATPase [Butyrivibrio sp.]
MSIVKAENLVFEYIKRDEDGNVDGINRAVDNVNIEVEPGQFIAIVGHNGSGKSTFARHINALLLPTEGAVYVAGKDTSEEENLWEIRQTAGMVFQNPDNQIVGTIVEEDVGFGPENLGVPTAEIWERVDRALESVGMSAYREYSPGKLSGGQKQRVAIAGVVAMRPKCIIMDEPTAMLDPIGRREVLDTVLELNRRENVTVILITHYMNEIVDADKVFVMDKGKVVMEGTPREIFRQADKLEKIRLEVPQATELAHSLAKAGIPVNTGVLTAEELVEEICRLY